MTTEEFKKHFSKQSPITDAKFIPHRRIGYVGYKSPDDASKAVKYHNKTFIRMSRIGVELARSVEEQSALRAANNFANDGKTQYREETGKASNDAMFDGKKRKREALSENEGKAKLQEFLEVMQPPSKSKLWENQDATISNAATGSNEIVVKEVESGKQSHGEYEPVPKKRKSERRPVRTEEAIETPQKHKVASDVKKTVPGVQKVSKDDRQEPAYEIAAADETPAADTPAASDADWLRSRTSRLLGLVDDEGAFTHTNALENEEILKDFVSPSRKHVEDAGRSDASVQTDEEINNEDPSARAPQAEITDNTALDNGRLFVRNLTYSTTENDLRRHFESGNYGTIEEVS